MAETSDPLFVSLPSTEGYREAFGEVPGIEFLTWDLKEAPPRGRIDIILSPYWATGRPALAAIGAVETRLLQWQSIGYNGVADHLPAGVPFANAATVHEASTAELALGLTIAAQRGIPDFVRAAEQHRWLSAPSFPSLADRRVLLIGYGGVGKAIEARFAGFEVEIERMARTARTERNLAGEEVPVRGYASAPGELHAALAAAEIVVLGVPLTDETRHLIDAAALSAMPDGALLVNVARGPVVDTDALIAELESGRLRAALDVTDPEPLPADHLLWACPNLLVTPHVGGDSTAMLPRIRDLLLRQIAHLQAGESFENLIDLARG